MAVIMDKIIIDAVRIKIKTQFLYPEPHLQTNL